MGLFARIAGIEQPKIGIWPFICDVTRVRDGAMEFFDLAVRHQLSSEEQLELVDYLTSIGAGLTANIQRRVSEGATITTATEDARVLWFSRVWHALACVEYASIDENGLRELLGLPPLES